MIFPLPGATVEITDTGYAVIRHCGHIFLGKLGTGDVDILVAVEKARLQIAEDERSNSARTANARETYRSMAAGNGG
jgi:hypothetical protein